MNRELYDIKIVFPEDMQKHMKMCFDKVKNVNKRTDGYKRNIELQSQRTISYPQLKRILNFFDNFTGKNTDVPFILNGGQKMKNWVENELRRMREGIYLPKKNKSNTGMQNQFIKQHQKPSIDVRASKEHSSTINKYDAAVTESLRRIKELISKI